MAALTVNDVLDRPSEALRLPAEERVTLLAQVDALMAKATTARTVLAWAPSALESAVEQPDELIMPKEAAKRLKCSERWIVSNADRLPFCRRVSARKIRVSKGNLDEYLANAAFMKFNATLSDSD